MVMTSQLCCVIITVCLMCLYYPNKKLYTTSNTVFSKLLISLFLICSMDCILSYSNLIPLSPELSYFVLDIVNRVKMISLIFMYAYMHEYLLVGVLPKKRKHAMLMVILIMTPLFIPNSNVMTQEYQGLYYWISLGLIFVIIAITAWFSMHYHDTTNQIKVIIFYVFSGLYCLSEILNIAFDISGCVSASCVIGIILMFYYVENPKAKIDTATGMYSVYFMNEYLDTMRHLNKSIYISVIYAKSGHLNLDIIYKNVDSETYCFKDTDSLIYIVSDNIDNLESILFEYRSHELALSLIYNYDPDIPFDNFRTYVRRYALDMSDKEIHFISADDVRKLDEDDKVRMEIIHALVEDRIFAYIQPIYSIKESRFVSGECLCRMKRRNGEIVPPSVFIPVAEKTGLVTNIESVMFRNLCKCLSDDRMKISGIKYLDVNLSIKKGEQNGLIDEYNKILREYSIDASKINLEITETDSVNEKLSILNNMKVMREQGFRFALDDFGTGESNLGYIIDMPVSIIKFDKEITQKAMSDDRAWLVVKNVIDMAHDLDIEVVIEGVEDETQFESCKKLNADYIQGYYFSKPLPVEDFIAKVSIIA